jgi:hypothetical protein
MAPDLLIRLSLTPHFDATGAASGLSILYSIHRPDVKAGETLLVFEEADDSGQRNHSYEEHDVIAFDSAGPFFLEFRPVPGRPDVKGWVVSRDTYGDVNLQLQVEPRVSDSRAQGRQVAVTPLGSSNGAQALQRDQGGLIGSGHWFLPLLACASYRGQHCTNVIEWDLEAGPRGTRAVCSFGEGPAAVTYSGDAATLLEIVFMVGPVQSWPEKDGDAANSRCHSFWFGNLPANVANFKDYCLGIFPSVSMFFRDESGAYRLFMQQVDRGSKGRGFTASSILHYDASITTWSDFDVVRALHHLMINSWIRVHAEQYQGGSVWFNRGKSPPGLDCQ